GLLIPAASPTPPTGIPRPFTQPSVWQAPLVPAALVITAGIVADRYIGIPMAVSLLAAVAGLIGWAVVSLGRSSGLALIYLGLSGAALGAAYHHWRRDVFAPNDVGNLASSEPRPVNLRGVIVEEPSGFWRPADGPLQSIPRGVKKSSSRSELETDTKV